MHHFELILPDDPTRSAAAGPSLDTLSLAVATLRCGDPLTLALYAPLASYPGHERAFIFGGLALFASAAALFIVQRYRPVGYAVLAVHLVIELAAAPTQLWVNPWAGGFALAQTALLVQVVRGRNVA